MISFAEHIKDIDEGINDPAIFKAIFLAGGPGSGKSFIVGKTGLTSLGFKVVKDKGRSLRAKTAPSDGVVHKDGKRIGTNESKVRVYARKPKPFTEAYVKAEGYLLSCHKIN